MQLIQHQAFQRLKYFMGKKSGKNVSTCEITCWQVLSYCGWETIATSVPLDIENQRFPKIINKTAV